MHVLATSPMMRVSGSRALLVVARGGSSRSLATIASPSPFSTPTSSARSALFPSTTEYPAAWFMPPPPPPPHPSASPDSAGETASVSARGLSWGQGGAMEEAQVGVEARAKKGELSFGDFLAQAKKEEGQTEGKGGQKKKKVCTKGCPTCSKLK